METLVEPTSVRNMREVREEKKKTPEQVAEAMRLELGEESRHFTSVTKMEKDGSYKVNVIRAYANAVGVTFQEALGYFESQAVKTSLEKKSKRYAVL